MTIPNGRRRVVRGGANHSEWSRRRQKRGSAIIPNGHGAVSLWGRDQPLTRPITTRVGMIQSGCVCAPNQP